MTKKQQAFVYLFVSLNVFASANIYGEDWITTTPFEDQTFFTMETKITEPSYEFPDLGRTSDQYLGAAVAQWENTLVIGAPSNTGKGQEGTVYVFEDENGQWILKGKLLPTDSSPENLFGLNVAIDGDTIVAGSLSNPGKIYVYVKPEGGWTSMTETAQLTCSNPNYQIGFHAAIQGDTIVAGLMGTGQSPNIACVFQRPETGWKDAAEDVLLSSSVPVSDDWYRANTVIQGDLIVAGITTNQSVYVYQKPESGWADATENAILTGSDIQNSEEYGYALALKGNQVYVGAPYHNNSKGAVYVYTQPENGWQTMTETEKLVTPNTDTTYSQFGFALAANDEKVVITAPSERKSYLLDSTDISEFIALPADDARLSIYQDSLCLGFPKFNWSGEVDLYSIDETTENGYKLIRKFPEASNNPSNFGYFMALEGDVLVTGYKSAGFACVYERTFDGWHNAAQLTTSDNNTSWFSAAICGNTIVLGSQWNNCAYVYTKTGDHWQDSQETAILTAAQPNSESRFSNSVALNEDYILIGAPNADVESEPPYQASGLVYVYKKPESGWQTMTETAQLRVSSPSRVVARQFGFSIAMLGNTVVVGDPDTIAFQSEEKQGSSLYTGSVYFYDLSELDGPILYEKASLISEEFTENDDFGGSVALTDQMLVVGCASSMESYNTRALIYSKPQTGWNDIQSVTPVLIKPMYSSPNGFGSSVAASDNAIVVGTMGKSYKMGYGMAFYLPKPEEGWQPVQGDLNALHMKPSTFSFPGLGMILPLEYYSLWPKFPPFGNVAALSGSIIATGDPYYQDNKSNGAVYIFDTTQLSETGLTEWGLY